MSAPRLSDATLDRLPPEVARPAYDRLASTSGVVHLGPGGFHRAHQAAYFDDLLHDDASWGVSAIALRSTDVADALAPQDGLYTLAVLDRDVSFRVIGALREVIAARREPARAMERLTSPATEVVTLTITEKGYCLGPDGALDFEHADVRRDISSPDTPVSAVGWLVEALKRRRAAGDAPFDVVSCDNLSGNGDALSAAVFDLAHARDPELARWISGSVRFPNTMVDAITPASDDALRARGREATGLEDAWPVQREAYTSWVVEETDSPRLAQFAAAGVTMSGDVAGHERAKLRLLNGAHSTLAYLGLARGHRTVAEAMRDGALADRIAQMMRVEIAPSLTPPAGLNLDDYIASILARFANPAIVHELAQIAWDGSQKLPIRLLGTIADNRAAGRPFDGLATGAAAWMRFVRRRARDGVALVDPKADALTEIGRACRDEAGFDVGLFLDRAGVVPSDLAGDEVVRSALETGYDAVMQEEARASALDGVGQ